MVIARVVSRLISAVKGSPYDVDPRVPGTYLAGLVWSRGWMAVRGRILFPLRRERLFVDRRVQVKPRGLFRFGPGGTLGYATKVDALSTDGVVWGRNVSLGRNSRIECTGSLRTLGKGMHVGDDVGLGTDCFYGCAGGIVIGSDTIIGNSCSFHAENHVVSELDRPIRLQGVTHRGIDIGVDCWIGARVTVLDGARVGDHSVIAAGAVVTAGVYPDGSIIAGVPGRVIRTRSGDDAPGRRRPDPGRSGLES